MAVDNKRLAPFAVTPNVLELGALLDREFPDEPQALLRGASELHALGVSLVWIRRGTLGSLLSTSEGVHELPALPASVRDVTGAGDAMLAAFLAALAAGHAPWTPRGKDTPPPRSRWKVNTPSRPCCRHPPFRTGFKTPRPELFLPRSLP
ncbi:PfkB family carbohydrate kinase [Deinococcus radiopugnans]|uniref:PfkB family carbohydrate kinase n=1 Tax=Deinococcus radiopugnans TaxID=57497 RepID=UPI00361187C3